jgi:hypothetical protein
MYRASRKGDEHATLSDHARGQYRKCPYRRGCQFWSHVPTQPHENGGQPGKAFRQPVRQWPWVSSARSSTNAPPLLMVIVIIVVVVVVVVAALSKQSFGFTDLCEFSSILSQFLCVLEQLS